ncbi:lipopolysaccharide assembly protein LapA domain-containing protein [Bacillus sonorensis]|nr:lipopolysaccharide assembly protein LapA domain-containing protein [Bacillus sonorensis]
MNKQWTLIAALIFTLIVAIFAVINVEPVKVDFLFGTAEWPLILVILASVLMGRSSSALLSAFQVMRLKKEVRALRKEERAKNRKQRQTCRDRLIHLNEWIKIN